MESACGTDYCYYNIMYALVGAIFYRLLLDKILIVLTTVIYQFGKNPLRFPDTQILEVVSATSIYYIRHKPTFRSS